MNTNPFDWSRASANELSIGWLNDEQVSYHGATPISPRVTSLWTVMGTPC